MKLEIINPSTDETIKTYSVPNFSMLDFQEWKVLNEVVIDLSQLSDDTTNLDSNDPETNEPVLNSQIVDFYLPDPIKNQAISQFAKLKTEQEELANQFVDGIDETIKQLSSLELKSSTILAAVVTEILQNYQPHSDYKVRISDG